MRQKKKIKLESIARELNTSTVTVSNALNGKKGVGERVCAEKYWTGQQN